MTPDSMTDTELLASLYEKALARGNVFPAELTAWIDENIGKAINEVKGRCEARLDELERHYIERERQQKIHAHVA